MRVRSLGGPTPRDLEYSELDEQKGYRMVSGDVGQTITSLPGVWYTSTTLQSDVHLAYHHKRFLSESEKSSRKLDAILYAMSSAMGVWGEEEDEDV
jgi:hypothetical protein